MLARMVMLGPVLSLLVASEAAATPFFAYGSRMEPGTLGVNPYLVSGSDGVTWSSLYVFAGVTDWLDVTGAGGGAFVDGGFTIDSGEAMVRLFPSPDNELALAAHVIRWPTGETTLGPELHLAGYPTEPVGVWANLGARYTLGGPAPPTVFAWFAAEVTGDVPFLSLEVDLESTAGALGATLIPSVGVWLGPEQGTGLSAGFLLPIDQPDVGFGLWLWRTVDLRGEGRRRKGRARPAEVAGA